MKQVGPDPLQATIAGIQTQLQQERLPMQLCVTNSQQLKGPSNMIAFSNRRSISMRRLLASRRGRKEAQRGTDLYSFLCETLRSLREECIWIRPEPGLWSLLLVAIVLHRSPALKASESQPDPRSTRYTIIVTGSELLSGAYADGHTYFITRTLGSLGLQCLGSMCVPDRPADIRQALEFSAQRTDLVIVTGGLGPTDNDLTREVLADFTGIALKEHTEALQDMARRFHVAPGDLRANLRRQTQVPVQGTYFKNENGTAVGLVFEKTHQVIMALPGPPRELQPMLHDALVPYLNRRFGTRLPGCSLTLRFVGLGQSRIDQVLSDHVQLAPGITLSSQFQGGALTSPFHCQPIQPKTTPS